MENLTPSIDGVRSNGAICYLRNNHAAKFISISFERRSLGLFEEKMKIVVSRESGRFYCIAPYDQSRSSLIAEQPVDFSISSLAIELVRVSQNSVGRPRNRVHVRENGVFISALYPQKLKK